MKRNWATEELIDYWTLLPNELTLLDNKTSITRLGFALLLKFFQLEARSPYAKNEIPRAVVMTSACPCRQFIESRAAIRYPLALRKQTT
jgi:uncharacterized membrane protein